MEVLTDKSFTSSHDRPRACERPDARDADSRLAPADGDSLRGLAAPVSPIRATPADLALDLFAADPTLLAVPVVDEHGTPVGLLNRFTFLQSLSGAEGQRLVLAAVADLMNASPLVADEDTRSTSWQRPLPTIPSVTSSTASS